MKSSNYSIYCHKILGKYITKNHNKEQLAHLNLNLEKANIMMLSNEYLSEAYMTSFLSIPFSLIFSFLIYLIFPSTLTIILIPVLGLGIPVSIWQFFYNTPSIRINQRKKSIDRYLPYAVNFINTMSVAGIYPVD